MVTPDNKITPIRDNSVTRSSDEKSARKAPSGDFDKVSKEVHERDEAMGDEQEDSLKLKKDKKKSSTSSDLEDSDEKEGVILSPYQLASGYKDASDEKSPSRNDEAMFVDASQGVDDSKIQSKVEIQPQPLDNKPTIFTETHLNLHKDEIKKDRVIEDKPFTQIDRFGSIEQPDLAAVSPFQLMTPATNNVESVKTVKVDMTAAASISPVDEAIDQIAKTIHTLRQSGQSETVVSLSGMFNGSRLIIQESDSAKGQLNITIDNLTAVNQSVLEAHKSEIIDELLKTGIQVHLFTASATKENTRIDVATSEKQEQGSQREGQQNNSSDDRRRRR